MQKKLKKGVDLIIPIYEKESRKIGTILIQVYNSAYYS